MMRVIGIFHCLFKLVFAASINTQSNGGAFIGDSYNVKLHDFILINPSLRNTTVKFKFISVLSYGWKYLSVEGFI